MPGDIVSIDLGSALPWVFEQFLHLVGNGAATREVRERIERQTRTAAEEAMFVQCVGMPSPVRLDQLYQPIDLLPYGSDEDTSPTTKPTAAQSILTSPADSIVFGGPGDGKTTLLHWAFARLLHDRSRLPLLFTLRRKHALAELFALIELLASPQVSRSVSSTPLMLLIDGYDEVPVSVRKDISDALLTFQGLHMGNFILTCRRLYQVFELKAASWDMAQFSPAISESYVRHFSTATGVPIDATELLSELTEHGFASFARHPLLLALVCILKSGPMPRLPRDTLGLLRRALETLTLRWDEAKGIDRDTRVPLDGHERVACLMRIAYRLNTPHAPEWEVHTVVKEHLRLVQQTNVSIPLLLQELAQFYGVFVPTLENEWEFTHRTIHDFLAARFWVEGGRFSARQVRTWDTRAAYAACLAPDATDCMEAILRSAQDMGLFAECLYNHARFDTHRVAAAVLDFFRVKRDDLRVISAGGGLSAETDMDFWTLTTDEFLDALASEALTSTTKPCELVSAYTLAELHQRHRNLSAETYAAYRKRYGSDFFRVNALRRRGTWARFDLASIKPQ